MRTLYVSDLDGTLLNDEACVSTITKEILNDLIAKGMCFTYATARSWSSAHNIMADVRLSLPAITYNGTCIVNASTGTPLDIEVFDAQQRDSIIDTFSSHCIFPLIYTMINNEQKVLWVKGKENVGINRYIESRVGDKRLIPVDCTEDLKTGDMFYATTIDSEESLAYLPSLFYDQTKYTYNLQSDTYNENEYWFELYPPETSKAEGVKKLKKLLKMEKVICFGDNLNDIPMFTASDECYAVANARDELKKAATSVIQSNTCDGVAKWLKESRYFPD